MFSRHIHLLKFILVCLCTGMLSLFTFSMHTFASSDPITVTSETYQVSFPTGIDFQLSATDASTPITQAMIIISSTAPRYIQEEHAVPISNPTPAVTLYWHEDTTNDKFFPPGSHISYSWQLQDRTGHQHTEPAQLFTIVDTRFSWQQVSQGLVQVHWYNRPIGFGQFILSQASANVTRIGKKLGGGLVRAINLWVYQTEDDFHGSLPPKTNEWVGGVAFTSLNEASIVVENTNQDTLIRDMPHELTHLIFHQLIEKGISAPIWFDEGLAVYNQIYKEPTMTRRLDKALATHTLIRLDEISYSFPTDADQAYLAYAQSWNLVGYMYSTFGQTKMAQLIKEMGSTSGEFEQDVERALGEDQAHLENQWRLHLNQPSILSPDQVTTHPTNHAIQLPSTTDSNAPLLLFVGILLVLLPMIGIVTIFVYQRRSLQRVQVVQQAQQILDTTLPSYGPAMTYRSYGTPAHSAPPTQPPSYPPAPGPHQPYPQYLPDGTGEERKERTPLAPDREYGSQQLKNQE